jgi:hypothetical protein
VIERGGDEGTRKFSEGEYVERKEKKEKVNEP